MTHRDDYDTDKSIRRSRATITYGDRGNGSIFVSFDAVPHKDVEFYQNDKRVGAIASSCGWGVEIFDMEPGVSLMEAYWK